MGGSELIFSKGKVTDSTTLLMNKTRFTLFLHIQNQWHYNFNKYIGLYSGINIINVGLTNTVPIKNTDADFLIKQRSYSLGIPLAIKLGNMETGYFIAFGLQQEMMFHYKRKVFYNNKKLRHREWFSDEVNTFIPSFFTEIRFQYGFYIRFKYYLDNFLVQKTTSFYLPETNINIDYTPMKSEMFYISIGNTFNTKKKKPATKDDV